MRRMQSNTRGYSSQCYSCPADGWRPRPRSSRPARSPARFRTPRAAAIPGAAVTLVSERMGNKKEFTTDQRGQLTSSPTSAPDTYTVEVVLSGFKTTKRAGVTVSPGDRVVVPALVLAGGRARGSRPGHRRESPLIQARSGERSFTVDTDAGAEPADSGPVSFTQLAALAPGVTGTSADRGSRIDRRRRHQRA